MLTMELTTWDGRSYRLPVLLSWCLTYTGGVPCDSMTASCPYEMCIRDSQRTGQLRPLTAGRGQAIPGHPGSRASGGRLHLQDHPAMRRRKRYLQ